MERVIELLGERNEYLQKFYEINERELLNLNDGNFETIENFYLAREKILDLIKCVDLMIDEENQKITAPISSGIRMVATELIDRKDEIVKEILAQDLQILSIVEVEKTQIIKELKSVQGVRKVLGQKLSHSGESLDEKA